MKFSRLAAVAAIANLAAPSLAATYVASRAVGSGSVVASFTTDGTTGALTSTNFVSFTVTISNNGVSSTLNSSNSDISIFGNAVSATSTDLLFNFDAAGANYFLVEDLPVSAANPFYCLETFGCNVGYNDRETVGPTGTDGNRAFSNRTGLFAFASVASAPTAPVPEPATWAMMIVGFGAVGATLRRARPLRSASLA